MTGLPPLNPTVAMSQSAHTFPPPEPSATILTLFQIASAADAAPSWWSPLRDRFLDSFWPTEPFLAGAIFSVASRNASFRYEFTGPRDQVTWAQQLLAHADFGRGWQSFMMKVTIDLLTMDNAAHIEIIRPARIITKSGSYDAIKMYDEASATEIWHAYDRASGNVIPSWKFDTGYKIADNPLELPVGLAHLDSQRISRTGNPLVPAIYTDLKGNQHKLSTHQIISLEEMPSPREEMNNVQFSAVSRALRLSQTLRDMQIYKSEKVSGRFARAIHLTNIDPSAIQDAVDQANEHSDNRSLHRYSQPIIAAVLDPNATPHVETLELASLPDGFDEETAMRWYIAGLALDLGVDFGFLAPLPGNKLGTSDQAETAARQSRGKSSRLFLNQLQYKFNFSGVLPSNVTLKFAVPDPYEESEKDRAFARRARARSTQIQSGEITPQVATQMAADVGDIDPKYLPLMGIADLTPIVTVSGSDILIDPPKFTPIPTLPPPEAETEPNTEEKP